MTRRVVFRPAAIRDLERMDRIVQARIDAALARYALTGHGDVKSLKDRPGEMRLRVGKWRIFFSYEPPDLIRVLGQPWRCVLKAGHILTQTGRFWPNPRKRIKVVS